MTIVKAELAEELIVRNASDNKIAQDDFAIIE